MRKFARSHWKILIAILLAIALATLTLDTDSAAAPGPGLSARLRAHVQAIASQEHDSAAPHAPEQVARHIASTLQGFGYGVRRHDDEAGGQTLRSIEVSIANTAPGAGPERIFIVGARYDAAGGAPGAHRGDKNNGGGTAAVLELARLLKSMRPSRGTEVKFVLFVNGEPPAPAPRYPGSGNFIAFVGTLEASALVRQAMAAFRAPSDFPTEGLAAPAHVMGPTLSDHSSCKRRGCPALLITDTAFLRYPYYHTLDDSPDQLDYARMARVIEGLARTIDALAGAARS